MEGSADWERATGSSRPIQVVLRIRPLQPHEVGHKSSYVQVDGETAVVTLGATGGHGMGTDRYMRNFAFDSVLSEESTQEELFQQARVREMLEGVLNGFHATIFAYGQTGSGKTHCMEGFKYKRLKVTKAEGKTLEPRAIFNETPSERLGIVPRAVQSLFASIKRNSERRHSVKVSYVQIYKEQVYDLLNIASFRAGGNTARSVSVGLKMRWSRTRQFYLENVYQCECKSADEVLALYQSGINNKFMASHKMNAQSSRSHTLFVLQVDSAPAEAPEEVISSKMTFVDLAGSERGSSAGSVEGRLQQESIAINKSLFALRKVITALADGKSVNSPHIPFRDSKLTSLLKHSLGGSSLTTMISCITPSDEYYEENLSTLEYSSRARAISNQLVRNEDPKTKLIRELRSQVAFLQEQLQSTAGADAQSAQVGPMSSSLRPMPATSVERDREETVSGLGASNIGGRLPNTEEVAAMRRLDDAAVSGATDDIQQVLLGDGGASNTTVGPSMGGAWTQIETHGNAKPPAGHLPQRRSKEEVIKQVELMGRYLLQSMTVLKQLSGTNQQLRQAYVQLYQQNEAGQALNDKLMIENAELTDKVSMLEGVISCSREDKPPGQAGAAQNYYTPSSATLVELDNLRNENKLLREWCQTEQLQLPSGLSKRTEGRSGPFRDGIRRSLSARPSHANHSVASSSQTQSGTPSRSTSDQRQSSSGSSGLMSVQQLEAVLSGSQAARTRSPASSSALVSGSGRGKRPSQGSIPAYMMGGLANRRNEAAASSGYAYSAENGQALRISTTGKLLPTASGLVSSQWSGTPSPTGRSSDGGDVDGVDVSEDPKTRLGQLFSSRNTLFRARLAASSGGGSS